MRKKIDYLFILFLSILLLSCNNSKSHLQQSTNDSIKASNNNRNDTIVTSLKNNKSKIYHFDTVEADTIIGDYHIFYKIQDDNQVIATYPIIDGKGQDTAYYANREVVLTISKEGKSILLNRKIKRKDFSSYIPKNEISKYCISYFRIVSVNPNEIKLSISFCVPDTDVCYWFELYITNDGKITIKEIVEEESDM